MRRADRWVAIEKVDLTGPRTSHGTAMIGFTISVIEVPNGMDYFNSCSCFERCNQNVESGAAHAHMQMLPERGNIGCTSVQSSRYFLAGVLHCRRMRASLCYELTSSAERTCVGWLLVRLEVALRLQDEFNWNFSPISHNSGFLTSY